MLEAATPTDAREEQAWNQRQLANEVARPIWRLWGYQAPSVVLGCGQRALLNDVVKRSPVDVIVRNSGGGAVLTGPWMLGLSVALPARHPFVQVSPVESYRWLGELIGCLLQARGIPADPLPPGSDELCKSTDLNWACFGGLSPWEVITNDRKIAGLAARISRNGVLLVGGVLLETPDWRILCRALGRLDGDAERLERATTSVAGESGSPLAAAGLRHALETSLHRLFGSSSP